MANYDADMPTPRRTNAPSEFGRDGITVMVDADRALRVREVGADEPPVRKLKLGLRERMEGRRPEVASAD